MEYLEGMKGVSGNAENERFGLVNSLAVPRAGLEILEELEGLKEVSGNFGSKKKERFDLL